MKFKNERSSSRKSARGLGLVELMIGVTVGLIVAAGASLVATRQITEHRRLMLEVQIQQDLRAAADLIQQDLRRAGFRGLPANGVWEPEHNAGTAPAKEAASSPYTELTQTPGGNDLLYRYARATTAGSSNVNETNIVADNEQLGIRLSKNTLYLQLGFIKTAANANAQPNWQPITDPDTISIDSFTPIVNVQQVSLEDLCGCPAGSACPTISVRSVSLTIKATAKSDATVKRTLVIKERIRADDIDGVCP